MCQIRSKMIMNSKSTNGKNLINQTKPAQSRHTILIRTKKMQFKKNTKAGNKRIYLLLTVFLFNLLIISKASSENNLEGSNTDIKILDKISSKNELIKLINSEEYIYKDLSIKSIKCTDSEFDDNPEIKAYIQVKDLTKKDRNNVFIFNGWMFSSSPSIAPFDHPVYDIWLVNCY